MSPASPAERDAPHAAQALVSRVREVKPLLQTTVASSDMHRQIPDEAARALRSAGVYRMAVPAALGGDEVDLQTVLDVLELVAEGNAAAAWDLATSYWATLVTLTLPSDGLARIFADGPDVSFAGGFAGGGGRASAVGDGYRVNGSWRFGSGSAEAQWMLAGNCAAFDGDSARATNTGQPVVLFALIPRHQVEVHDTWYVAGLRGTGSHDWSVNDAFVPEVLTQAVRTRSPWPGAHYQLSYATVINAVHFSAVATGIARRAIGSFVAVALTKTPGGAPGLLRERVQAQEALARAEALVESARAYRTTVVAELWGTIANGGAISVQQRARVRLAGTHATESAARAVDLLFNAAGTTALEDANPLSHCFRDVHAVAQNVNVATARYENVGRVFLGLESGSGLV